MMLANAIKDGIIEVIAEIMSYIFGNLSRFLDIIWSALSAPVYYIISMMYNVFVAIPQIDLLSSFKIEEIYQRITMIIVIVMAFYITFEVVKYVVQPDAITDKSKGVGNAVFKIITVILLIAFVPRIFTIAYDVQAKIINSNVIPKIVFGSDEKWLEMDNITTLGGEFAADVFGLFYHLNEKVCPLTSTGELDYEQMNALQKTECSAGKAIVDANLHLLRVASSNPQTGLLAQITGITTKQLGLGNYIFIDGEPEFVIVYAGLLAFIVGAVVSWVLIVYGLEIARRYFQLIYLQIMAPVAIMGHLAPKKDGTLSKWAKQCLTTYLDLFIRLIIINFILLLTHMLHESFFNTESVFKGFMNSTSIGTLFWHSDVIVFIYIFLIIGLFMFALKAPKLLKELFPTSGAAAGEFGLIEPTKKIISGASRTIGGVVGAYSGAKIAYNSNHFKNKGDKFLAGAKGMFAGAKAGFAKGGNLKKARSAAAGSVHKDEDTVLSGGTVMGATFHGHSNAQIAKAYDRQIADLDGAIKAKGAVSSGAKETKVMKTTDSYMNEWAHRNIGNADTRGAAGKAIEKATREYAVSSRDETAQETYRSEIGNAVSSVYDESIEKTRSDYRAQVIPISKNLYTLLEEQYAAQKQVETLTAKQQEVGLDAEEMANLAEQQRIVQDTKKQVGTIYNSLTEEQQVSIGEIEKAMNTDIAKLEKEKQEVTTQIGKKVGADETVFDQVKVLIEEAKRVSKDVIYKNPSTGQEVRIDNTKSIQEFAKDIGDVSDNATLGKQVIESSAERRAAKANAEASGKSDK